MINCPSKYTWMYNIVSKKIVRQLPVKLKHVWNLPFESSRVEVIQGVLSVFRPNQEHEQHVQCKFENHLSFAHNHINFNGKNKQWHCKHLVRLLLFAISGSGYRKSLNLQRQLLDWFSQFMIWIWIYNSR